MIKADPKPHKRVEYYKLVAQLDVDYEVEVSKTTNGSTTYEVVSISPAVREEKGELIIQTIINFCNREGLGQIENK
jgi:hypothetical protein